VNPAHSFFSLRPSAAHAPRPRAVALESTRLLRRYGVAADLNPEDIAFNPQTLKLIPSIPELDGTDPGRRDVCYTGNLLEPIRAVGAPFVPEPGEKYVFCYLGTGSISLDRAGGGFMGEQSDFNTAWIRARLDNLAGLADGVLALRRSFQSYHGAATADARIRQWLEDRAAGNFSH
jgi:hypothetical protein